MDNDVAKIVGGFGAVASLIGLGFAGGLAWPESSDEISGTSHQTTLDEKGASTVSTAIQNGPSTVEPTEPPTTTSTEPASTTVTQPPSETTVDVTAPPATPETTTAPSEVDLAQINISEEYVDRYTFFSAGHIALNEFDETALWCFSEQHNVHYIEFRLDRRYSTFSAFVGYSDSSRAGITNAISIRDENGVLLYGGRLSLGMGEWIELDVSGVIRLRFICDSNGDSGSTIGIGNPTLKP